MESEKSGRVTVNQLIGRKNGSWKGFFASFFKNPSFLLILLGNIAIFFIPGLSVKDNAYTLLWIYLAQSMMIGLVHCIKLVCYRFSAPTRPMDWKNPKALAAFFVVHYGFFHFIYAMFIPASKANWTLVLEGAAIFAFSLIVNTIQHYSKENSGNYNANDFMFLPYVRIVPIHMAIILGGFFSAVTGNAAVIVFVLVGIKIVLELFLEYLQQLGMNFSDLAVD